LVLMLIATQESQASPMPCTDDGCRQPGNRRSLVRKGLCCTPESPGDVNKNLNQIQILTDTYKGVKIPSLLLRFSSSFRK
ncbi:hypothetical protein H4R35_005451, partial [Dimargaris xerosporica]